MNIYCDIVKLINLNIFFSLTTMSSIYIYLNKIVIEKIIEFNLEPQPT